jgi:hypothetical protein
MSATQGVAAGRGPSAHAPARRRGRSPRRGVRRLRSVRNRPHGGSRARRSAPERAPRVSVGAWGLRRRSDQRMRGRPQLGRRQLPRVRARVLRGERLHGHVRRRPLRRAIGPLASASPASVARRSARPGALHRRHPQLRRAALFSGSSCQTANTPRPSVAHAEAPPRRRRSTLAPPRTAAALPAHSRLARAAVAWRPRPRSRRPPPRAPPPPADPRDGPPRARTPRRR